MSEAPTQEAYDAACKALWKHRDENKKLKKLLIVLGDKLGGQDRHAVNNLLAGVTVVRPKKKELTTRQYKELINHIEAGK